NGEHILISGYMTADRVIDEIRNLDEPFDTDAVFTKKIVYQKRAKRLPKPATAALFAALRKGLDEVCLLQQIGQCDRAIARAHSVQKSAFAPFANDNHVYHFDVFARPNDNRRSSAKRIGVKRATTFTGFCRRHDAL